MACSASLFDTYNIVWDSGASMYISNKKHNFPEGIQPIGYAKVDKITSHSLSEGVWNVSWSILDIVGNVCDIILPTYCAPKAHQQSLSTQVFCKHFPNNSVILNPKLWTIQPDPNQSEQHSIDILINPNKNLQMIIYHRPISLDQLAVNFSARTMHASNSNLSEPHKRTFCSMASSFWLHWFAHCPVHYVHRRISNLTCYATVTQTSGKCSFTWHA